MARRRFEFRGLALTIEVPDRIARLVRRDRTTTHETPALEFAPPPERLNITSRAGEADKIVAHNQEGRRIFQYGWQGRQDGTLAERVATVPWYHTMELPGGIVTNGLYDHRALVPHYGIPDDLTGKRVLDVGPWDGFWSFEFERRGGDVTVVDLDRLSDTDMPPLHRNAIVGTEWDQHFGGGFKLAKEALGSKVERVIGNIYKLDPEVLGTFDLVHVGDVLLHLEDPIAALRSVRSVTRGWALLVDNFDPDLTRMGDLVTRYRGGWTNVNWWEPSLHTLAQMVIDAGFSNVEVLTTFRLNYADTPGVWHAVLKATP